MKKEFRLKFLELDDKKLSDQWLFWLSILIPLFVSIMLCIPLWAKSQWDLSAKGYEVFLTLYKLPIGILSLSIPFVAIVAHIHRTIQTAEQIKATKVKNTSDSFFSHHKYITENVSKIPAKKIHLASSCIEYRIEDPYHIYSYIFEGSSYENGVNTKGIENKVRKIYDIVNHLESDLEELKTLEDFGQKIFSLTKLEVNIRKLEGILSLSYPSQKIKKRAMHKNPFGINMIITEFHSEDELKDRIRELIFFTTKILQMINMPLSISDSTRFYIGKRFRNEHFLIDVFNHTIDTTLISTYNMAPNGNSSLDDFYKEYCHRLKEETRIKNSDS
ncbi:hypothetical protein [Serratia quinivorans]|uniref:hypothetical protein n=1 Tax=Serratia quinivorans TaxID=137545 RepID=UPI0021794EEB|nr:hypothetical protein [Serratia quinivorans]CAI0695321.1 Uncharacterised protein [Serratia quinivorans]CAI1570835.1 Uncharacterised protein [Serratia quinivorans]